ncbi:MAG: sugar phosphate isomerase/epimerase [Pirellulaceae bacterium]|jgi:inosose dehydratase|nr:sugar phosphate isomerase/epimerase [Pirellulaceae bacterium]MDP7018020.1 sugar phosphate isomerase/epimerase [Pirellulaceae bacterium]
MNSRLVTCSAERGLSADAGGRQEQTHSAICRRQWLLAASAITLAGPRRLRAATPAGIGLGFSLYGARSMTTVDAIAACHKIGYDCVELPVMPDWPGDSGKWNGAKYDETIAALKDHNMRLSALMENLPLLGDQAHRRQSLVRLERAAEVGQRLGVARPVIETILGGRPQNWKRDQAPMAKELEAWAKSAEKHRYAVAIKAHVGGAMHLPEHPVALAEKIGSPSLRCAYDFSHFQLRNVDLIESLRTLLRYSIFIHVKDARGDAKRVQFLLPGQGTIDYHKYLTFVNRRKYRGDMVVEVSGQIHSKPGYDPIAAATDSYRSLAKSFADAGIRRG